MGNENDVFAIELANAIRDASFESAKYLNSAEGSIVKVGKIVEGKIIILDTAIQVIMGKPVDEAIVSSAGQWVGTSGTFVILASLGISGGWVPLAAVGVGWTTGQIAEKLYQYGKTNGFDTPESGASWLPDEIPLTDPSTDSILRQENLMYNFRDDGLINSNMWSGYTDSVSSYLSTSSYTFSTGYTYNYDNFAPIGAFYEAVSPAADTAASIADKTPVLLDTNNHGVTAAQLQARDANVDGNLPRPQNLWVDL